MRRAGGEPGAALAAALALVLAGPAPARADRAAGADLRAAHPAAPASAPIRGKPSPAAPATAPTRGQSSPAAPATAPTRGQSRPGAPATAPTRGQPSPGAPAPAPAVTAPPATPAAAPGVGPDPDAQSTSLSGPGPLVANGLGSPSCRDPRLVGQLSGAARANCDASGVVVAPAALENYELDVHIDNGLLGTSFDRLLQDLIVKPGWMAILW
ncbi:MAG: hypothetical protein QOD61_1413, partial [Solirubrobacteraceae bacterium]|nr:hypothetical protein [Solirubrobacteraceae bacterium]